MKFAPLLVVLVLTSCVSYRFQTVSQPQPDPNGLEIEAYAQWAQERDLGLQFDVSVTNNSGSPVTVDSKRFRLFVGSPKDWHEVRLLSGDESYREAERLQRERPTVTFSTVEPVYRQRQTTIISNGNGNTVIITRQPEPTVVTTSSVVLQRNPGRLEWLKDHLFFAITLQPGESHQGLVFGELGKGTHYKLVLSIEGKTYEAVFERVKETNKGPFKNLN